MGMFRSAEDDDVDDIDHALRSNPKVDVEKLAEVLKLVRTLRKHGVSGPGYNLLPPFR